MYEATEHCNIFCNTHVKVIFQIDCGHVKVYSSWQTSVHDLGNDKFLLVTQTSTAKYNIFLFYYSVQLIKGGPNLREWHFNKTFCKSFVHKS
jgi:hypothetical protein